MNWRNRFRREIRREVLRSHGLDPAVRQEYEVLSSTPTSGRRHSWLTTNLGRIRKPNGTFEDLERKLVVLS